MSLLANTALRERIAVLARGRRAGELPTANDAGRARAEPGAEDEPERDNLATDGANQRGALPAGARGQRAVPGDSGAGAEAAEVGVEAFLPGGEWRDGAGAVYVHERLRSDIEHRRSTWGRLGAPPEGEADLEALATSGLERALFLDLETGGLASSPVFLAGTMYWNGSDFVLRQYFARHYGEEAALLRALAEQVRGFEYLVTFNGKSYDAPFLMNRAIVNGVKVALPPRHIDLLHPARRRWKHDLRDCRLQTLETHVCRRRRTGDVPSEEVPALYHDFVRRGDPYRLVPVFHHNLLDVITMGEILDRLCSRGRGTPRSHEPLAEQVVVEWGA